MAKMNKKGPKTSKLRRRTSPATASIAKLKKTIDAQAREIREGREQQAATGEILRMIAKAPANLQAVIDAIAEKAARLCAATDAAVWRVDGEFYRLAGHFGPIPMSLAPGEGHPVTRDTPASRAIFDRQIIHVHDLRAAESEFPLSKNRGIASGLRTVLSAPLLCDGRAIGSIHIRRMEVRPFTDEQIKLLETFADQAVIAIENARLFQELTEALEQQKATSQILGVIASSPTDLQTVLDAVAENAARVCSADRSEEHTSE